MQQQNLKSVTLVRPDGAEATFVIPGPLTPIALLEAAGLAPASHTLRTLDGQPITDLAANLAFGGSGPVRVAVWPKMVAG